MCHICDSSTALVNHVIGPGGRGWQGHKTTEGNSTDHDRSQQRPAWHVSRSSSSDGMIALGQGRGLHADLDFDDTSYHNVLKASSYRSGNIPCGRDDWAGTEAALVMMRALSSLYPLFTAIVYVPSLNFLHLPRLDFRDVVSAASRGSLVDHIRPLGDVVSTAASGLIDLVRSLGDAVSTPSISLCIGGVDRA
ncbi:hypothetical protein LA080_005164 [Diaporthe eres]|nr:hypothetical protein LA080_005164 [Diaporthe eres]